MKSEKDWLTTFLLCIFTGIFGGHRFYSGKIFTALIWLFTVGLFGFGWLADMIMICCGTFTDRYGNKITWKQERNPYGEGNRSFGGYQNPDRGYSPYQHDYRADYTNGYAEDYREYPNPSSAPNRMTEENRSYNNPYSEVGPGPVPSDFGSKNYSQNHYSQNHYGQNPYSQNPYGQNRYEGNPYGQKSYGSSNKPPKKPAKSFGKKAEMDEMYGDYFEAMYAFNSVKEHVEENPYENNFFLDKIYCSVTEEEILPDYMRVNYVLDYDGSLAFFSYNDGKNIYTRSQGNWYIRKAEMGAKAKGM